MIEHDTHAVMRVSLRSELSRNPFTVHAGAVNVVPARGAVLEMIAPGRECGDLLLC